MTVTVVTFLWGNKYSTEYVDRLGQGLWRYMGIPYRFVVITDRPRQFGSTVMYQEKLPPDAAALTSVPGCFCRLKLFDLSFQADLGIKRDDRILVLDLDLVVVGELAPLVQRTEPFVILHGVNSPTHPCRFNGSVSLMTAGHRPDTWWDFGMEAAKALPIYSGGFPGDQEWYQHKIPNAAAFTDADGVYAFHKGPWPAGYGLPENARIVAFPGSRDPAQFVHLPFVRKHWLGVA